MFKFLARSDDRMDREIQRTLLILGNHEPSSKEYGEVLERLQKLYKLRDDTKRATVSPDTAVTTIAYFVGMLMIIHHEHVGVITTKAMSHLTKPK